MSLLQKEIIEFLSERNPEPMKPRSLARRLGIKNSARSKFNEAVEALIGQGKMGRLENGKLHLAGRKVRKDNLIRGTLRRTQSGSAWLIPDPVESSRFQQDVFIYPEHMSDAQNGDIVLVRLSGRRGGGGRRPGLSFRPTLRST